jgi:hypothetical protein
VPAETSDPPEVRLTEPAAKAFRKLPKRQAHGVAEALDAIGKRPANNSLPGADGKEYMIIAPADPDAPAIIYRELDDESGYLVLALAERGTYDAYDRANREGSILDSPLVKAVATALGAAAVGILLGSRSGKTLK